METTLKVRYCPVGSRRDLASASRHRTESGRQVRAITPDLIWWAPNSGSSGEIIASVLIWLVCLVAIFIICFQTQRGRISAQLSPQLVISPPGHQIAGAERLRGPPQTTLAHEMRGV